MRKIVAIVGPTATGKTELALKLCRKFNGEIISVDSRQAYREMEIGTGKKLQNQVSGIRYQGTGIHLYNIVNPSEQLNAFEFSKLAWEKIEEIRSRGKAPFLVGGTGFYLDVILGRRQLASVSADPVLRRRLESLTTEELVEELRKVAPKRWLEIDRKNRYRLMRAIEIGETRIRNQELGIKVGVRQGHPLNISRGGLKDRENFMLIGLTAENSYLYRRADERVERMMKNRLLDEVGKLAEKYGWESPGMKTLGYREFRPYFEGKISLVEAVQRLKFNTHAYIRRQKTYFKKNPDIVWLDITSPELEKEAESKIESFLR